MIKIKVQQEADADFVNSIIAAATDELRTIYRPINKTVQNKTIEPINLVASTNGVIVGVAEYLISKNNILLRGVAVSPSHRKKGVAGAIIEHVVLVAQKEGKPEIVLSTIKETGNAIFFSHMGFAVVLEEISAVYESPYGKPVTLVNMRKTA